MAKPATVQQQIEVEHDGIITADVYVEQQKIAAPGDRVEVGTISRGKRRLCRLASGKTYWIEESAWSVE